MLETGEQELRRAACYLRVSTIEQQQQGLSMAAQRRRLRAAAEVYGYEPTLILEDCASGGTCPTKRPGLLAALEALRTRKVTCLVIVKLDRLSRNTLDALQLIQRAERERWELVSLTERLDTASAHGRFVVTMLAALSEMERAQLRERTLIGMEQVRVEGRARSRYLPFGFRVEGKPEQVTLSAGDRGRLVPHEPEQEALREILRLHDSGLGGWAIASALNRAGGVNPRSGRAWSPGGVRSILRTARA